MAILFVNNVRLKERNTRRKIQVRRKSERSTTLVNQSTKKRPIPKMTQLKGEKERLVIEILTRSITRPNQIQSMNQVKEKGKEGRITMKIQNTEKDPPVTTRGKEMSKTIKKMLMTETITSQSQEIQKVDPSLMPQEGGM